MHRVFIVEDHPVVRQNYVLLLAREPGFELCGTAATRDEALANAAAAAPDLILLDISLGGSQEGMELLPFLREQLPNAYLLVVSGHEAALYAEKVRTLGANGYVAKGDVMVLLKTLRALAASPPEK